MIAIAKPNMESAIPSAPMIAYVLLIAYVLIYLLLSVYALIFHIRLVLAMILLHCRSVYKYGS